MAELELQNVNPEIDELDLDAEIEKDYQAEATGKQKEYWLPSNLKGFASCFDDTWDLHPKDLPQDIFNK